MIWPQYERHKQELMQAQEDYNEVINMRAELFQRTQPSAVKMDQEVSSGSLISGTDKTDSYLIRMEQLQLEERIKGSEQIVTGLLKRQELDRQMLRLSTEDEDIIYYHRYIHKKTRQAIAKITGFSDTKIKRISKKISEGRMAQNGPK